MSCEVIRNLVFFSKLHHKGQRECTVWKEITEAHIHPLGCVVASPASKRAVPAGAMARESIRHLFFLAY